MKAPSYTLIEHTADTGIRVRAPDLPQLFVNAGLAMFDIIAEKKSDKAKTACRHSRIELQADNREELFVNWLSELLSLAYAEEVVISSIKMERFTNGYLFADVSGEDFRHYKFKTEIKAVTYHHLRITQLPQAQGASGAGSSAQERPGAPAGGWEAEVIFDV